MGSSNTRSGTTIWATNGPARFSLSSHWQWFLSREHFGNPSTMASINSPPSGTCFSNTASSYVPSHDTRNPSSLFGRQKLPQIGSRNPSSSPKEGREVVPQIAQGLVYAMRTGRMLGPVPAGPCHRYGRIAARRSEDASAWEWSREDAVHHWGITDHLSSIVIPRLSPT